MSTGKENMTTKKCPRCKKSKPIDDFYKKSGRCKFCDREYHQIRRMDPEIKKQRKEYHTRYMREWRKDPHKFVADRTRVNNSQTLSRLINNFDLSLDNFI